MPEHFQPTWDLDAFFPGGSESPAFVAFLGELESEIAALAGRLQGDAPRDVAAWRTLMTEIQAVSSRLGQASSFVLCLNAQNIKDDKAKQLNAKVRTLFAANSAAMTGLDRFVLAVPPAEWGRLLQDPELAPIAFWLQERRTRASEKLPPEQEALVSALSVDGYHAWGDLYDTIVGRMAIPHNGQQLSVGQAHNAMETTDRQVRAEVFRKWEEAWEGQSELIAAGLNSLAGYRVALYKARGWDSILKEPLHINRMAAATLDAMWDTIAQSKQPLVAFLGRKAQLLGVEKCAWHDVTAPLGGEQAATHYTYDEACQFILEHFTRFSPKMADMAYKAFADRWIEAEDRPGKRPGGFMTGFPLSEQSRIFMTFSGTPDNVSTLAHELGHAFHSHVMWDLPPLNQDYAMNVAETASTFAEVIVGDAAVKAAKNPAERLALLERRAQDAVVMMMNIHTRFIFETRFYAQREQGTLTAADLNALMQQAQEEAFCGALSQYHPTFWAAKGHFYSTDVPFYNFPYTFGFLFSAGIYARAKAEGPGFEAKYVALLRDTGRMTVEELAQRHLGVDLTKPDFWQSAIDTVLADVHEFLRVTAG